MENAKQAKSQSLIAFNLARETLDNHQRATDAIQDLKRQQAELKGMMARAVHMARKTQDEAKKAHDVALAELTDANNTMMPEEGDIEGISSRARSLNQEVRQPRIIQYLEV